MDPGGGNNVGYLENGDWAEYSLDVSIPGRYAIDLRYASPNGDAGVELRVNSEIVATFQPFTSTGNWQAWNTQRLTELELPEGEITLRITALAPPQQPALNYNWIDLSVLQPSALERYGRLKNQPEKVNPFALSTNPCRQPDHQSSASMASREREGSTHCHFPGKRSGF